MKPNKNKIIIIIVAVLLIAVIIYFLFFKKPKVVDTTILNPNLNPNPNPKPTNTTPVENDNFPLMVGSKGNNVKYLQNALNKINPTYTIKADGSFGTQTKSFLLVTMGTSYYPVTTTLFTEILKKANNI